MSFIPHIKKKSFTKSVLSNFLVTCAFGIVFKKSFAISISWFCLMLPSTIFIALALSFISLIFFLVKLGIWCQVRLQSHYFACVYTVFMQHFLKMTLPIEWSCQNLFNHIHAGLFLNCLVYLISLYICLYVNTILF